MTLEEKQAIKEMNQKLTVTLPDGTTVPALGQGTWHMAEQNALKTQEIEALRLGISLGMTLIDTAEMYANGKAESLVGEAIRGMDRESLFLVSKVYPHNAGSPNIFKSCENSLKRLGVDALDLYLLHWRGSVPLAETVECMEKLVSQGLIKRWGVSNFDTEDMMELWDIPGGDHCAVNQVLYHLGSRGIEFDLLPWLRAHKVPLMAYCPTAQAGGLRYDLLEHPAVANAGKAYSATPIQVLLSFLLQNKDVIAIPKASSPDHVTENAKACGIRLGREENAALNRAFPPPAKKTHLDIV